MRVLLDLDGCVVDSLPTWLAEYRAISGDAVQVEDIKEYGFDKFVAKPHLLWKALTTGDVFRRSHPMPDAIRAMQFLNSHHDLHIVTYVHESVRDGHRAKLDWLAHWAPFLREEQVIFTKHKYTVDGDIMIEDAPYNLIDWIDEAPNGGDRFGYLVDHIYNRKVYNQDFIHRVGNLWQVIDHMRG